MLDDMQNSLEYHTHRFPRPFILRFLNQQHVPRRRGPARHLMPVFPTASAVIPNRQSQSSSPFVLLPSLHVLILRQTTIRVEERIISTSRTTHVGDSLFAAMEELSAIGSDGWSGTNRGFLQMGSESASRTLVMHAASTPIADL